MQPPPVSPPSGQNPTDRGSFVFNGTVVTLNAATMNYVPVDERTATVRVDEVLQAPDILRRIAGQDITVYLGNFAVEPGERATFSTEGVIFGESIAVSATSVRPLEGAAALASAAPEGAVDPADNLRAQRAEERFTSAEVVVKGRVKAVEEAAPPAPEAALASAAAEPETTRYSEHDPVWMKATVEVEQVHKGLAAPGETVEILFPASTDVAWHRAPKFQPGQEGVFMLHKEPQPEAALAAAAPAAAVPYTALDPADFQSAEAPQIIESVLSKHQ